MCNKTTPNPGWRDLIMLPDGTYMELPIDRWRPLVSAHLKRVQGSFEKTRIIEKCVYVFTTLFVIGLSHAVIWYQEAIPIFYVVCAPLILLVKTIYYWRHKLHYFMIDFCYFANTLTIIYIWYPDNADLFRTVFAVANGPLLMAAVLWRNSLVFHHHDKITSCFVHLVPGFVTFSLRWFPMESSSHWFRPMLNNPEFDVIWLFVMPFAFFFAHSVFYCIIVNIIVKPKDPYMNSYEYLAIRFAHLNISKGPLGQMAIFYGLNYLFCLCALPVALLAYWSFPAHCAILVFVFVKVAWNGGSYYMHVFSERGFEADADN